MVARLQLGKTAAQTRVYVERAANLKLDRLVKEGELVPRDVSEQRTARNNHALRLGLQRLSRSLRQPLADEDDPAVIEQMLARAFQALCDHAFGRPADSTDDNRPTD